MSQRSKDSNYKNFGLAISAYVLKAAAMIRKEHLPTNFANLLVNLSLMSIGDGTINQFIQSINSVNKSIQQINRLSQSIDQINQSLQSINQSIDGSIDQIDQPVQSFDYFSSFNSVYQSIISFNQFNSFNQSVDPAHQLVN